MKLKTFTVTVNHDDGTCRIKVISRTSKSAKYSVMKSELCPENAIQSIVSFNKN